MESEIVTGGDECDVMVWGINASYEQKKEVSSSDNLRSTIEGEQLLAGSDVRIEHNSLMLNGEFVYSWILPDFGGEVNPFGCQVTAGYFVLPDLNYIYPVDREVEFSQIFIRLQLNL